MGKTTGGGALSDAPVPFSVTGDLAHRMIFPALLRVPISYEKKHQRAV